MYLHQAFRLKPDYAEAGNNLGMALSGQGKFIEAVAAYEESLRLRPTATETHVNLAIALAALGQSEVALACYQEALRLEPNAEGIRMALAPGAGFPVAILAAALGRFLVGGTDHSIARRTGPGRHRAIHPLRAAGEAERRHGYCRMSR